MVPRVLELYSIEDEEDIDDGGGSEAVLLFPLILPDFSTDIFFFSEVLVWGPKVERRAGRKTRPWNTPYSTVRPKI